MQEGEQQPTISQQPQTNPSYSRRKVLQPSSSFIEEIKASQQAQPNQLAQDTPQGSVPIAQSPQQTRLSPSQIYPDAVRGLGVSETAPAQSEVSPDQPSTVDHQTRDSGKEMIVRIVAGLMIVFCAGNAVNWLTGPHDSFFSVTNFIGISVNLILAVGLFRLSETARSAFLYLSAIILTISAVSFVILFASTRQSTNSQLPSAALEIKADEAALKQSYSNTSLTPAQRAQNQKDLQNDINRLSGSPTSVTIKEYLSTGLLFATSGVPIIFFTRPAIKKVFH